MSNVGRPRTGLRACPYCGSTERDSNGQCACRNTLYRLRQRASTADQPKVKTTYDDVLKGKGGSIEDAVLAVRQKFDYLAPKKAAAPTKGGKGKASKPEPKKATKAQKKAQVEKAEKVIEDAKAKAGPARYLLDVEGQDQKAYARKDAAIKNGVRSGQAWTVTYKGKVVAGSDDLL
jgi:hypothetical protein